MVKKDLEKLSEDSGSKKKLDDNAGISNEKLYKLFEYFNNMYMVLMEKAYECSRYISDWLTNRDYSEKHMSKELSSPYGAVRTSVSIS